MKKAFCILLTICLIAVSFCACSLNSSDSKSNENEFELKITHDATYNSFDESVFKAYETLCKSVIDGKDSARFNTGMLENVNQLFYTSFPLNALVESIESNNDSSGVTIKYKNSSSEHLKKVDEFKTKVNDIMVKCYAGTTNKKLHTVNLYNYIASSIQESEDIAITPYETIISGKGSSFSYSNMFEYLLQQADIKAYHILAEDAVETGWGLSKAEFDGKEYYFDVMTEYYDNGGKQLLYFGMTTENVEGEGLRNLKYTNKNTPPDLSEIDFEACRSCKSWEIKDNKLLVTTYNDIIVEYAL